MRFYMPHLRKQGKPTAEAVSGDGLASATDSGQEIIETAAAVKSFKVLILAAEAAGL